MKKILYTICLLVFALGSSQETKYKDYSYTEFFKLIENDKDSVFTLKDALIQYNPETDSRFKSKNSRDKRDSNYKYRNDIVINKTIELDNVQFLREVTPDGYLEGVLLDIHFKKRVYLRNVAVFSARYCRFDGEFQQTLYTCDLGKTSSSKYYDFTSLEYSTFKSSFQSFFICKSQNNKSVVSLYDNSFTSTLDNEYFSIYF